MNPQNKLMDAFNEYIAFRKGAGYSTADHVSQLVPFIDFCNASFPGTETVTQEMVDGWIKKRSAELHAKSLASLVGVIRQFSRFLCFLGMEAFIPDDEWLGHASEETTRIYYAKATDDMKRKAQQAAIEKGVSVFDEDVPFEYADDEEALKKLCGLK